MGSSFDYLFPPACCACNRAGSHLCDSCREELANSLLTDGDGVVLDEPYGRGKMHILTACRPGSALRHAIHAFKYTYNDELLGVLGETLLARLRQFQLPDDLVIVPAPLHPQRVRERGFNQSLLLGRYIGSRLRRDVSDILERVRATFPQAQLSKTDRVHNVHGAFRVRNTFQKIPANILLLDDVVTTGSTFAESRWTLSQAGAENVFCVALSHGL